VYDRQAVLDAYGVEFDALAFFCALSDEFGSSTGRTGHGACALDCLLNEFDGFQNREGAYTVEQVMAALKFVADLDDDVFPGEAETVAARFRAFVEDDVPLPAAAAGDDQEAHAVAAAIIAFLSSAERMTRDGSAEHHQEVLDEMWHFADYLCQEVESHASLDPPLKFPEKRWAANARA